MTKAIGVEDKKGLYIHNFMFLAETHHELCLSEQMDFAFDNIFNPWNSGDYQKVFVWFLKQYPNAISEEYVDVWSEYDCYKVTDLAERRNLAMMINHVCAIRASFPGSPATLKSCSYSGTKGESLRVNLTMELNMAVNDHHINIVFNSDQFAEKDSKIDVKIDDIYTPVEYYRIAEFISLNTK